MKSTTTYLILSLPALGPLLIAGTLLSAARETPARENDSSIIKTVSNQSISETLADYDRYWLAYSLLLSGSTMLLISYLYQVARFKFYLDQRETAASIFKSINVALLAFILASHICFVLLLTYRVERNNKEENIHFMATYAYFLFASIAGVCLISLTFYFRNIYRLTSVFQLASLIAQCVCMAFYVLSARRAYVEEDDSENDGNEEDISYQFQWLGVSFNLFLLSLGSLMFLLDFKYVLQDSSHSRD